MTNKRIIVYNLTGKILYEEPLDVEHISRFNGQKSRITNINHEQTIGYLDRPIDFAPQGLIRLFYFDFSNNSSLYSLPIIKKSVLLATIIKIELILYSNPRWGSPSTNTFKFTRNN